MHNTITAAASCIAAALSTALLGRQVITQKWGLFAGGLCTVIELNPDENAPEIVLQVRHDETGDEVGIFADEMICLVCESSRAVMIETAAILKVWEPGIDRGCRMRAIINRKFRKNMMEAHRWLRDEGYDCIRGRWMKHGRLAELEHMPSGRICICEGVVA